MWSNKKTPKRPSLHLQSKCRSHKSSKKIQREFLVLRCAYHWRWIPNPKDQQQFFPFPGSHLAYLAHFPYFFDSKLQSFILTQTLWCYVCIYLEPKCPICFGNFGHKTEGSPPLFIEVDLEFQEKTFQHFCGSVGPLLCFIGLWDEFFFEPVVVDRVFFGGWTAAQLYWDYDKPW